MNLTEEARIFSENDRDYYDNKQWTEEEAQKLRSRNQNPIVVNRIKPKVEGLKGLLVNRKTDPKAFPRTMKHEKAAEVVTDGLRFVDDNVGLDQIYLEVSDNVFVEGYGGAIVDTRVKNGEVEVNVSQIPWDRIYYDPHSRRRDFKDARYMGIIIWMDREEALQMFPGKKEEIENIINSSFAGVDETFEDRPKWVDSKRERLRIAQEFYRENGEWKMIFFSQEIELMTGKPSPFLDEDGVPTNPIELVGAYIDRENNRFGEVRFWKDLQDEINHRRSKALHMLSTRQTFGTKGAIPDVEAAKRELAKPDGHVEIIEGTLNKDFGVLPTGDMAQAQFELLNEAKREIDAVGFNAQLSGEGQGRESGKAIIALQQAATNELASLYAGLSEWKKRIYKQIWARIKNNWNREKWVRVTDDQTKLRWVGFNVPITLQQRMEEIINDESENPLVRKQVAAQFVPLIQSQDPRLQELVEVRNPVAELEVDIIIEQSPDIINIQQEQFSELAKIAQGRPDLVPFSTLLKLSSLRNKDELIKEIEERQNAAQQAQQQAAEVESAETQADIEATQAKSAKTKAETTETVIDTVQKLIENEKLSRSVPESVNISV